MYHAAWQQVSYRFSDLKELMAKATPLRSGDVLAGVAARSAAENVAAKMALADVPLKRFLSEAVIPYESCDVTRLIMDRHDAAAFAPVSQMTVGEFRDWLLSEAATTEVLARLAPGITPEMAAATSKIMRNQDLILAARKAEVVTRFRDTIGLRGRMAVRLQPNHPTDDRRGISASIVDGLLLGCGDAVIGVNPASDNVAGIIDLLAMLDDIIQRFEIPTQACVLTHVTTSIEAMRRGAPVDLLFQSIGGTEAVNTSFGVTLAMLREAREAALGLKRGTVGDNVMYFETGPGLRAVGRRPSRRRPADARGACLCGRARVRAAPRQHRRRLHRPRVPLRRQADHSRRPRRPLLRQAARACRWAATSATPTTPRPIRTTWTSCSCCSAPRACTFVMGVPGADDIMLNYQSTSFHDALYVREALGLRPAPEFEAWLERMGLADEDGRLVGQVKHALLDHVEGLAA